MTQSPSKKDWLAPDDFMLTYAREICLAELKSQNRSLVVPGNIPDEERLDLYLSQSIAARTLQKNFELIVFFANRSGANPAFSCDEKGEVEYRLDFGAGRPELLFDRQSDILRWLLNDAGCLKASTPSN